MPRPGDYRVVIAIDGEDVKEMPFRVQARTAAQPAQAPETGTAGYL